MSLSNITVLSSFTDKAPLSPAYFNGKFGEVNANFQTIAGGTTDSSAFTAGPWIFASDMTGTDWSSKVNQALALLPTTGGVVDARSLYGRQDMSSHVTLGSFQRVLVGAAQISMNANSVVVTSGSTGASLVGIGPWGTNGGAGGGTAASTFSYSGTSSAFLVGSSVQATVMVELGDFGVMFDSTTSAAAIWVNRALLWRIRRPRISMTASDSSLYGIVLDGTSGYVGHGLLEQPWISNGYRGIWLRGSGVNAPNGNTFIGGSIAGATNGDGMVLDAAGENTFSGMDFENWGTGVRLAAAADNNTFSQVRFESNTTDFDIAAGGNFNKFLVASLSVSSWRDLGTFNTVWGGGYTAIKPDLVQTRNQADAQVNWILQGGLTASADRQIRFRDGSTGTDSYSLRASNAETFSIAHAPSGVAQVSLLAANLQMNPLGTGQVQYSAASGSGGVGYYDGNALLGASITSNGFASFGTGSAIQPGIRFLSEQSLGFFKSGASSIKQSYGTFIGPALWATSGLSVGNATAGGTLIPAISSVSTLMAAFVVQGSASSFTRVVWAAAQPGDQVMVTIQPDAAVSSLSSGLVLHSHCTQAGQVEVRLSNVSTLVQNQSSKTYYLTRITPF